MRDVHLISQTPGDGASSRRCDALRNRELLLAAAWEIIDAGTVAELTMDGVARGAGVGKGTVFRHFGSRSGLMSALLDHSETEFQNAFMFGPPPLGPGAAPAARLHAYGRAAVERFQRVGELQSAAFAENLAPYQVPAYMLAHRHVAMLVELAGVSTDPVLAAYSLLGVLDPLRLTHQLRVLQLPAERIVAHWDYLVDSLVG